MTPVIDEPWFDKFTFGIWFYRFSYWKSAVDDHLPNPPKEDLNANTTYQVTDDISYDRIKHSKTNAFGGTCQRSWGHSSLHWLALGNTECWADQSTYTSILINIGGSSEGAGRSAIPSIWIWTWATLPFFWLITYQKSGTSNRRAMSGLLLSLLIAFLFKTLQFFISLHRGKYN